MDPKIRALFSQAYILGGSPCSGKSTIAERLASHFDLRYYKVDDYEQDHLRRADPDRHPVMARYADMDWNEIWSRPVAFQVEEEFEFYRERFGMILEDLAALGPGKSIILEGAALLPELIKQYDPDPSHVVYMVPSRSFQIQHYQQRAWIQRILKTCDDPKKAFDNWMERDYLFGQTLLNQAEACGYQTLVVDGSRSIDELTKHIALYFGLT